MGSKSSSGSLVKSVETMLPKGVNLKHVLLAVLVGLLLCMMFGQTVEGYTCKVPNPLTTGFTGLTAGSDVQVGDSGSTVPPNLACDSSAGYTGTPTVSCPPQTAATCKKADNSDCSGGNYDAAAFTANPSTTTCNDAGPAGVCTYTAATAPTAGTEMTLGGCTDQGTGCTTSSGPYQMAAGGNAEACTAYCTNVSQAGSAPEQVPGITLPTNGVADIKGAGFCDSTSSVLGNRNKCARYNSVTNCEAHSTSDGCKWTTIVDYANTHTLGSLYDPLMAVSQFGRYGCGTNPSNSMPVGTNDANKVAILRSQITTLLPLNLSVSADTLAGVADNVYTTTASSEDKNSWNGIKTAGDSNYYDFFRLLLGSSVDSGGASKGKISTALQSASNLPPAISAPMIEKVKRIEDLWDEYDSDKTILNKNGGRIIAGYNSLEGLIIRNPPTKPLVLPGVSRAWHSGPGCSGTFNTTTKELMDTGNCALDTSCSEILSNLSDISPGDRSLGATTYCNLPACAASEQLPECTANRAIDDATEAVRDAFQGFISGI